MGTIKDMLNRVTHLKEQVDGLRLRTFTIPVDADGMIDRQCPKEECHAHFKVNDEDWTKLISDDKVFCPFCHNETKASDYLSEQHRTDAVAAVRNTIMNVWNYGGYLPDSIVVLEAQKEFEVKIQCGNCNTRYAVVGAAYFCPCCGFNSVERTAFEALEKMKSRIQNIRVLQTMYEEKFGENEAAVLAKYIIEKTLVSCISTLQSFCETTYNSLSVKPARFNVFQNIIEGNKLWIDLKGQGYSNWVTSKQYSDLITYSQRRHLLEHKNGIIDAMYLQKSNDTLYRIGDRIVVNADEVLGLVEIIEKIITEVKSLT